MKFLNLTGMTFGDLFVLKQDKNWYINPNSNRRVSKWICKCIYGNVVSVARSELRSGGTKSCGCLISRTAKLRRKKGVAFNNLFSSYKTTAKKRNIEWNLDKNNFKMLTIQNCYYCNINPQQIMKSSAGHDSYIYNGIDRIDSSKGYELDNCVTCCKFCNSAKMTMSQDEFKEWIKRIYNHWGSK